MKIKIDRKVLVDCLDVVGKTVSSRGILPILAGVVVEAKKGKLVLKSTDLELSTICEIPCDVLEEGGACLPARITTNIVKSVEGDVLVETQGEGSVKISSGQSEFSIKALPLEDYPVVKEIEGDSFKIAREELARVIKEVAYCASKNDMRPPLTGCLMEMIPEGLKLVATDTYRLAVSTAPVDVPLKTGKGTKAVITPAKMFNIVTRILRRADKVEITIGEQVQMRGKSGEMEIAVISRLIEGKYPDWEHLIPKKFEATIVADKEVIDATLARMCILSEGGVHGTKVEASKGKAHFLKTNPELGNASETVEVETSGEAKFTINEEFLSEAVKVCDADSVEIKLAGDRRLIMVNGKGKKYPQTLIMLVLVS
ncbi:MAG: DNA polymerase III subunit beta [Actinomycetota bacterium]|nr:DNA polymerase III subunit beta [Actinomycetota bacterium]